MKQLVQPNPNISCQPGWCLEYVQNTFQAPVIEPFAISAWNNTQFKHYDQPPLGLAVPIWFSLQYEPAGHVALWMPDGSVYSTSSPTSTKPTHHASLQALIDYYASSDPLTYLGWSEDIETLRVVGEDTMNKEQAIQISLYARLLGFETVEQANSHSEDDISHIMADPGYAGALLKQIYLGEWQKPAWKATNYDKDIAELSKEIATLKAQTGDTELAKETNSIVKQILAKLTSIFK